MKGGTGAGASKAKAKARPALAKTDTLKAAKTPAKAPMSAVDARLYAKLLEEREALKRQIAAFEAQEQALAEDPEAAEILTDLESGDIGASVEREMDLQKSATLVDLLGKVERAIVKLESGTYGVCASCGGKIPRARLQALPHADLCVSCQERFERRYA